MTIDLLPSIGRALLYLGIPFVLGVFVMQWKWARTCERYIRVLVAQKGGGGEFRLAPKEGGEVTITDDNTGSVRTWPVNELATIDVLYPGVGFVPSFMQKTIRLAIVNEGDWEPMLNRSPHRKKVASPDVVEFLKHIAEGEDENFKVSTKGSEEITKFLTDISTGPTREMIADPSVLGNLMKTSVLRALATVSNDLTDAMKSLNNRLSKVASANPMVVYIGLGLSLILLGVVVYLVLPLVDAIETINQSLGIR